MKPLREHIVRDLGMDLGERLTESMLMKARAMAEIATPQETASAIASASNFYLANVMRLIVMMAVKGDQSELFDTALREIHAAVLDQRAAILDTAAAKTDAAP